jgi:hypothetical protein
VEARFATQIVSGEPISSSLLSTKSAQRGRCIVAHIKVDLPDLKLRNKTLF